MALWPGLGSDGGDLIQGLAISTVGGGSPCNLAEDQLVWCVTASTFDPSMRTLTIIDLYESH